MDIILAWCVQKKTEALLRSLKRGQDLTHEVASKMFTSGSNKNEQFMYIFLLIFPWKIFQLEAK